MEHEYVCGVTKVFVLIFQDETVNIHVVPVGLQHFHTTVSGMARNAECLAYIIDNPRSSNKHFLCQ